jgi:hypothetical protein
MEAIVGTLCGLIVAAIVLYLARSAYNLYELNTATSAVADEIRMARTQAENHGVRVSVIFDSKSGKFGLDRNSNGKLDNIEAEELPEGVSLSDDAVVTFTKSGDLAPSSKQPQVVISNSRNARSVTISSLGSIEIKDLD